MIKSIEQYRTIDLTILSLLAMFTEVMGELLHLRLPGAGFHLTFAALVGIIAMFRWNEYGGIVLVAAGLPMIVLGANSLFVNILLYPIASGFGVLGALIIGRSNKEEILINPMKLFGVIVIVFGSISLGKGFIMFILEGQFIANTIMYFLSQSFTMIMSFVVLLLVKKRGELLIDMKKYFEMQQLEDRR